VDAVRRVAVVGTSGAGKTTFARALAARLDVPHVELDSFFHQAGWTELPTDEFRAVAAAAVAGDAWVVDGNYTSKLGSLVNDAADTIVWLHFPRWLVTQRIVRRTARRVLTREELWNGNREPWTNLWSRDPERNVIVWSWTSHHRNNERRQAAMDGRWVVLRSPAEARRWLAGVSPAAASA
jgi:adenylate kinase family enzyme